MYRAFQIVCFLFGLLYQAFYVHYLKHSNAMRLDIIIIPILQIKKTTFTNVDRMVKVGLLKHTLKQSVLLQAGSVIFLSGFMSRKSKVKTGRI